MNSETSLVERALGADWCRWRRKLPPHLRVTLPHKPPGGPLARQLAQMALRARRTWIANGRPPTTARSSAQAERDWLMLLKLDVPDLAPPETASRDQVLDELRTCMLDAAPDAPIPVFSGIPVETRQEWLRSVENPMPPARPVSARSWRFPRWKSPRAAGGHGQRHDADYSRFDLDWYRKRLRSAQPNAAEWQATAVAFLVANSLKPSASRSSILEVRDMLAQMSLPGSELAVWFRNVATAAEKGGGGRRTIVGMVELLLSDRVALANAVEKSGEAMLASRIRSGVNYFKIGSDSTTGRGVYYHWNVIGAPELVKDDGVHNGVVVFWSDYFSKVQR